MKQTLDDIQHWIDDVKKGQADDARRENMIELVRELLAVSLPDMEEIPGLSENGRLTDYLITAVKLAGPLNGFFENALPFLEEELKAGEFEKQIRDADAELYSVMRRTEKMTADNADLLSRKEHLARAAERLTHLETEVERLKETDRLISAGHMDNLADQLKNLEARVKTLAPEKERLERERDRLENLKTSIETAISEVEKDRGAVSSSLFDLSSRLTNLFDGVWEDYDERLFSQLKRLRHKTRIVQDITARLDDCMEKLRDLEDAEKANRSMLEEHFDSVRKFSDTHSPCSDSPFDDRVRTLAGIRQSISEQLKEYDRNLAELIRERESIVARIRKLNKTG